MYMYDIVLHMIGVHELYLFADDPLSLLVYLMVTSTNLVAGNLPINDNDKQMRMLINFYAQHSEEVR